MSLAKYKEKRSFDKTPEPIGGKPKDSKLHFVVHIQPGGWWLAHDIRAGKAELNFSAFGDYSSRKQGSKLFSITKSIEDGKMPIPSYTLIHKIARLTKDEAMVIDWADKTKDSLSLKN